MVDSRTRPSECLLNIDAMASKHAQKTMLTDHGSGPDYATHEVHVECIDHTTIPRLVKED